MILFTWPTLCVTRAPACAGVRSLAYLKGHTMQYCTVCVNIFRIASLLSSKWTRIFHKINYRWIHMTSLRNLIFENKTSKDIHTSDVISKYPAANTCNEMLWRVCPPKIHLNFWPHFYGQHSCCELSTFPFGQQTACRTKKKKKENKSRFLFVSCLSLWHDRRQHRCKKLSRNLRTTKYKQLKCHEISPPLSRPLSQSLSFREKRTYRSTEAVAAKVVFNILCLSKRYNKFSLSL